MKNSSREKAISESDWRRLLPRVETLHSKNVVVLMGGVGAEREVSLNSGKAVFEALSEELDRVKLVEIGREGPRRLKRLLKGADIVFIALHGAYGEDGMLQGYLDEVGVRYTGSGAEASRRAMLKDVSREMFLAAGIPMAAGSAVSVDRNAVKEAARKLGLPVVVKPADSGSSIGVSIVQEADALDAAYDRAARETKHGIIVEKYVKGTEVTVGILDNTPLPVIELRPAKSRRFDSLEFFDYQAKYSDPRTQYVLPADIPPETYRKTEQAALAAFRLLGCSGFGRVDMIVGPEGPVVLEVNTIPGFTSHSLVPMAARRLGLDMTALAMLITALAEGE